MTDEQFIVSDRGGAPRRGMEVKLNPYEQVAAVRVGSARTLRALVKEQRNLHGLKLDGVDRFVSDIESAGAELAAAKAINQFWSGEFGFEEAAADIGVGVQVRYSKQTSASLILRERDDASQTYILVTGEFPVYRVVGWISGWAGKRQEYRRAPGGRPSAYFVPQSALNTMDTLIVTIEGEEQKAA